MRESSSPVGIFCASGALGWIRYRSRPIVGFRIREPPGVAATLPAYSCTPFSPRDFAGSPSRR